MSSTDLEAAPDKGAEDPDVKSSAESSEAEGVETPSFSDTVLAALEKPDTEAAPATESGEDKSDPGTEKSESADAEASGDEGPKFTEEELKEFKHHTSTRIRQLVDEKNTAQETAKETTAQLESLKPKVEQFDQIIEYMRTNDINSSEFDNALKIVSLIKNDPRKAFEVLTPVYRSIAEQVGKILPEDLQKRVAEGHLSEDDARRLHESKSHVKLVDSRTERQAERNQVAQQQQALEAQTQTVVKAADDWSTEKAASDPDWQLKQDLVAEQVELVLGRQMQKDGLNGYPKTRDEMLKLSEDALKVVESRLKALGPRPKEQKVVTQDSATPQTFAKPDSVEEAMGQALAG